MRSPRRLGNIARWAVRGLLPNQRLRWTREGRSYILVWFGLLGAGLYQQNNLLLLAAGFAAGSIAASALVSAAMVRRLGMTRRNLSYVFAGDVLTLDYTLINNRRRTAALAVGVEDDLAPFDRAIPGASRRTLRVVFARMPARGRTRVRWEATAPVRGRYRFEAVELITRAPFGLLERRLTTASPDDLILYPTVGRLSRRWQQARREATESRRGQKHDRTIRQQECQGLRDYRPGDNLRSIHWRSSAKVGRLMVKEFKQRNDQDLAVLVDPWLPKSKVAAEQREALEASVRFAATVCLETCRRSDRRLLLGWTRASPGIRQGPASARVLHELLEVLATLRPATEGELTALLDVAPPVTLRGSFLVVVSTRPIQWMEETERSSRLSGPAGRGLAGRVLVLDASRGDLDEMVRFNDRTSAATGLLREPKRDGEPQP